MGFLAGLHPFWNDVSRSALGGSFGNVLAVELAVRQYLVDVDEFLRRIQQILDGLIVEDE